MKQKNINVNTRAGRRQMQQQILRNQTKHISPAEKSRNNKAIAIIIAFIILISVLLLLVPKLLGD